MAANFNVQNDLGTAQPYQASGVFTQEPTNKINFSSGDTITIGARTYTFQSTLTLVDGHVHIGAAFANSIANLANAILGGGGASPGGGPGIDYYVTNPDPLVEAGINPLSFDQSLLATSPLGFPFLPTAATSNTMPVYSQQVGLAGNAIATTYTPTLISAGSWGAATLVGGLGDANAYVDVGTFKQYFDDRGMTAQYTGFTTAQIQVAIVLATDYVDRRWFNRFLGVRLNSTQSTQWPRDNVVDDLGNPVEGIPLVLKKAISEYALRALTTVLLNDGAPVPSPGSSLTPGPQPIGRVSRVEQGVGPLKQATDYDIRGYQSPQGTSLVRGSLFGEFPAADLLMEQLLVPSSGRKAIRA